MDINMNLFVRKTRHELFVNEREPMASLAGIKSAANEIPGAIEAQMDFKKEMDFRKEPPAWSTEAEMLEAQAAGLTIGSVWKEMRNNLNEPGAISNNIDALKNEFDYSEHNKTKQTELNEQEFLANDEARKRDRKELQADLSQAASRSGKSQVAQAVRKAYMNLTGANIKAVRQAFDKFAG